MARSSAVASDPGFFPFLLVPFLSASLVLVVFVIFLFLLVLVVFLVDRIFLF